MTNWWHQQDPKTMPIVSCAQVASGNIRARMPGHDYSAEPLSPIFAHDPWPARARLPGHKPTPACASFARSPPHPKSAPASSSGRVRNASAAAAALAPLSAGTLGVPRMPLRKPEHVEGLPPASHAKSATRPHGRRAPAKNACRHPRRRRPRKASRPRCLCASCLRTLVATLDFEDMLCW